jgi:3-hydroxyphenylacetate 6-hydroxylase
MANTLAWTIGLLAWRLDIQETAYHAIQEAYGDKIWGSPHEENKVPYITALAKEVLRYFTVLRLSLPRTAYRGISYKNMVIPKGTTVFLNAWACNRGTLTPSPHFTRNSLTR